MKAPKGAVRIDIGIPEEKREKIAQGLSRLLADSFTLYLMTHNFHWNVTGPMFNALHQMFMTAIHRAVDRAGRDRGAHQGAGLSRPRHVQGVSVTSRRSRKSMARQRRWTWCVIW